MISFLILESRCRVSHSKRKESPDSREFIPTATGEPDCIRARRHLCPGVGMAPGREVEYRPHSGAPFAHLQWNKNRLRALPTSWKALGQSGNTQGSPASFPGHAPWLPARWSEAPAETRPKGLAPLRVISALARKIAAMDESIRACDSTLGVM